MIEIWTDTDFPFLIDDEEDFDEESKKETYENWDECEIAQKKHNRELWAQFNSSVDGHIVILSEYSTQMIQIS